MLIKNDQKQSLAGVLSSVVAEMAKPRVAESAKRVGDKFPTVGIYLSTRPQKSACSVWPQRGVASGETDSESVDPP
jgi:hypothetical protein